MTAIELNEEISNLRAQENRLKEESARYDDARARALAVEPACYNEEHVRQARSRKAQVEQAIGDVTARIGALESQLPSAAAIRGAEADAKRFADEARAANARTAEAWKSYIKSLEDALAKANELVATRATALDLQNRLQRLAHQFAIVVPSVEMPRTSANEARFPYLAGVFLGQASQGPPNEALTHELNAARTARPVRSEGAA